MASTPLGLSPLLAFVLSCGPLQISGAGKPTDRTTGLTGADIAYVTANPCAQTWVTGDAAADLETALQLFSDRHVLIVEGNPVATATALEHQLRVSAEYRTYADANKVITLSHELVHYCHRDLEGNRLFEASYLNSAGRWRTETAAYLQSFRTMALQCVPLRQIETAIEHRLISMRNFYLLWDIDPEQYVTETRRIWRAALVAPDRC